MWVRGEALREKRAKCSTACLGVHGAQLRRYVECHIDDEDEVSDLVSEVFSLAWIKLDVRKPPGLIWLRRVADNKLKDRERNLRSGPERWNAIPHVRSQRLHDILDTLAVRHAIDRTLTAREKHFVTLFYWERLAAGEIAAQVGCTQASVFTTLSRARAKLEAELRRDGPEARGQLVDAGTPPRAA